MGQVFGTIKKKFFALVVFTFVASLLAFPAFAAEQAGAIPEPDNIYVNGDNNIFTLQGDLSALLRLVVTEPGRVHILTSGVDVTLVIFDEASDEVRGVYGSVDGVMDASFEAIPGTYLLGFSGWGEAAVLVADEAVASAILSEAGVVAAPVEPTPPAYAGTEEDIVSDEPVTVEYRGDLQQTVSVASILRDSGAEISVIKWVAGEMDGRLVRAEVDGDWLLTPYVYFDSLNLTVRASDNEKETLYTLIFSNPDPAQESVEKVEETPAEKPAEETIEETGEGAPTEETGERTRETPADKTEKASEDFPKETGNAVEATGAFPAAEEENPAGFDSSVPITARIEHGKAASVLSIMMEAGAPVNVITYMKGEFEGKVAYIPQNGDWLLTPYNYFDSLELTVTATDFQAANPEEGSAVYTVILSNPDPDAPPPLEETTEVAEGETTGQIAEETSGVSVKEGVGAAAEKSASVTISMERAEGNVIHLFPEKLGPDADEIYSYQWQVSMDNTQWTNVEGAESRDYIFILDETTSNSYWRLVITEKEVSEEPSAEKSPGDV